MKNMAKICSLIATCVCFSLYAESPSGTVETPTTPSYNISIISSNHPASEPKGLFIVDFRVENTTSGNSNDFKYRLYCPNLTVRDITPGQKTGELTTVEQEDATVFNNYPVLAQVSSSVCNEQVPQSKGLPQ
ncbi:hypothetical protein [Thorsellia anophelis]|uniref:Uncharacterized protein n=1 Tax=Thorsellia anophelis DSM 18579 TaxID=1123402 RepID=A0A1H9ZVC3_9GAMM|nr:hypothetical protein [Thorsellia anophelis]SES85730.1 hypothetical protein SAMN02583745_00723 [Thorsellia anophelis DSM 18579]